MITYMLDTNICIYIIKKQPQKVFDHFKNLKIGQVCISAITFSELQFGVSNSAKQKKNQKALNEFLGPIDILDYPSNAGHIYGTIRADLQSKGLLIGPNDLLIAAHAICSSCILVSNNTHEFSRISGLKLENWA